MSRTSYKITALYCRLSNDDESAGDSMSIQNQKLFLQDYADRNGFTNIRFFVDDGYSGVDFERRKGFQNMLREVEAGRVSTVIVKDLSRLGRNYLRIGELTEVTFPEKQVRFIAVNDDVDTVKGDNEFTPLKNWFNEFYARDTSKKIKAIKQAQAKRGERVNGHPPPYGFRIDPSNRHRLIHDPETAHVVRQIFYMYVQGARIAHIQSWLSDNEIIVPAELHYRRNEKVNYKRPEPDYVCRWSDATLYGMLSRKEYIGHSVTNKTSKISYKSKKKVKNPDDEQYIFLDTHEPIIGEDVFEQVQKRLSLRQRPAWDDTLDVFSGILFCADCGLKLHVMRGEKLPARKHAYNCRSYRNRRRVRQNTDCTSHYIRRAVLDELILSDIKRVSSHVAEKEADFIRRAIEYGNAEVDRKNSVAKKKLADVLARLDEIERVFRKAYEDTALGRITDEHYASLVEGFDAEKETLIPISQELQREIERKAAVESNAQRFVNVVKGYMDIQHLTYEIVHELIDKIIVHEVDLETNTRFIEVHYNFIGRVDSGDLPVKNECKSRKTPTTPRVSIVI